MKNLIIMALAGILAAMPFSAAAQNEKPTAEDFTIVQDKVENGLREIVATPSALVCAKQMKITIDPATEVIKDVVITGGCPGNGQAVARLLTGMTVDQSIEKLLGVNCAKRGTSCTDQLARILKKAFNK